MTDQDLGSQGPRRNWIGDHRDNVVALPRRRWQGLDAAPAAAAAAGPIPHPCARGAWGADACIGLPVVTPQSPEPSPEPIADRAWDLLTRAERLDLTVVLITVAGGLGFLAGWVGHMLAVMA